MEVILNSFKNVTLFYFPYQAKWTKPEYSEKMLNWIDKFESEKTQWLFIAIKTSFYINCKLLDLPFMGFYMATLFFCQLGRCSLDMLR